MKRIARPPSPFDADFFKHRPGGQDHDQSTHAGGRGGSSAPAPTSSPHAQYLEHAKNIQAKARELDGKITGTVEDVAKQIGAKMVGLEHRIKTKTDRIAQKMAENAAESNLTPEQARETIYDSLRYTMELDPDSYAAGVERTLGAFKDQGVGIYDKKDKNYWAPDGVYRGLNYVMEDKSGFRFELQFHTRDSLRVKGEIHGIYEEFRKPGVSLERRQVLWDSMLSKWDGASFPKGVERLGRPVVQSRPGK